MYNKISFNNLPNNRQEYKSFKIYLNEESSGFKYLELEEETFIQKESTEWNSLFMFLHGEFICNLDQKGRTFNAGTMVFVPRNSVFSGGASKGAKLLLFSFDTPPTTCDQFLFESLGEFSETMEFNFQSIQIRYPLSNYLEVLAFCMKNRVNYQHLNESLEKVLFMLIRGFYTREEIAQLFHPIIGSSDFIFKKKVMENFQKTDNIAELIDLCNMGRSNFFTKFKKSFGITAQKWIVKQKDQQILNEAMTPGMTSKELSLRFRFKNQNIFTTYCKHHFGLTPKQLIDKYGTKNM